jgi:hypothetical protein
MHIDVMVLHYFTKIWGGDHPHAGINKGDESLLELGMVRPPQASLSDLPSEGSCAMTGHLTPSNHGAKIPQSSRKVFFFISNTFNMETFPVKVGDTTRSQVKVIAVYWNAQSRSGEDRLPKVLHKFIDGVYFDKNV